MVYFFTNSSQDQSTEIHQLCCDTLLCNIKEHLWSLSSICHTQSVLWHLTIISRSLVHEDYVQIQKLQYKHCGDFDILSFSYFLLFYSVQKANNWGISSSSLSIQWDGRACIQFNTSVQAFQPSRAKI